MLGDGIKPLGDCMTITTRDYDRIREQDSQRMWVVQILSQLQKRDFFGTVSIKMEKGQVRRVVLEENLIPPISTATGSTQRSSA